MGDFDILHPSIQNRNIVVSLLDHPVVRVVFEAVHQDELFVQVLENFDCCVVVPPVALLLPLLVERKYYTLTLAF